MTNPAKCEWAREQRQDACPALLPFYTSTSLHIPYDARYRYPASYCVIKAQQRAFDQVMSQPTDTPNWPSLYDPSIDLLNIQHRQPVQPAGSYLTNANGQYIS